jgi:hypothetical protein
MMLDVPGLARNTIPVAISSAIGHNIDIAIKLMKMTKALFERKLGLIFADMETVSELNGCRIEAYPIRYRV